MVEIVNTLNHMDDAYDHEQFKLNKWLDYIQPILCGDMNIFLEDMIQSTTICGYSFEKDYLPVLNNAYLDSKKRNRAIASFEKMTDHLEVKIKSVFGRSIDARVVLYLGLCNGAGWACEHGGKQTVYLGIEKIIELDWTSEAKMAALIYHELGHLYQKQYGILEPESENLASVKLWQLFTEGIAMVFEQKLMGDDNFFHQDTDGWLLW